MKIEHVAFNVSDPLAMARWYVEHLGFQVKRRTVEPPYMHFLADDSGTVMLEIYRNDQAPTFDFKNTEAPTYHLALVSGDVRSDAKRLIAAGAKQEGEIATPASGDELLFLRDPWGVVLQLVTRAQPMV